jgi:hypothetical protein
MYNKSPCPKRPFVSSYFLLMLRNRLCNDANHYETYSSSVNIPIRTLLTLPERRRRYRPWECRLYRCRRRRRHRRHRPSTFSAPPKQKT